MDEVWTLQRSTADGKLAGVCSTVATRYGVDPLLVRLVFVLLALSAGIGLAVYGAAWLLLPSDKEPVPVIHRLLPASRGLSRSTWQVLVVVATFLVSLVFGQFLTIGLGPVLVVGALWWFGVIKPRGAVTARRSAALPAAASEGQFLYEAQQWRTRVDAQVPGVDWRLPAAGPGRGAPRPAVTPVLLPQGPSAPPAQPYSWQPAPWANTYEAQPVPYAASAPRPPATQWPVVDHASAPEARAHSRRRRWLAVAAPAGALAAWVVLVLFGVTGVGPYVAASLFPFGLALIAATWLGRPRGLLPVAVALLAITLVSLGPTQASADYSYRPDRTADLPQTVSAPVGDVLLDLTDLTEASDRVITVQVAAGNVRVICPDHVNLVVEARLGAGSFLVHDAPQEGPGTFVYQQQPDPSAPTLTVIVELALGDLEVMAP